MLCPDQDALRPILEEASKQEIQHLLCVSVSLERFKPMMELIEPHQQVSASVGVHPDGTDVREPEVDELVELGQQEKVVAIGETGLDYGGAMRQTPLQSLRGWFALAVVAFPAAGWPILLNPAAGVLVVAARV